MIFLLFMVFFPSQTNAAIPSPSLSDKMRSVRSQVMIVEQSLIVGLKEQKQARMNIVRLKKLIELQEEERRLGQVRIQELEQAIGDLEERRGLLKEKVTTQSKSIRRSLKDLMRSFHEQPRSTWLPEQETLEAPRRKVLSRLVDQRLHEVEVYKIDLQDADRLEIKIREERAQLDYLVQELQEQKGLMQLSQDMQMDLLKKRQVDRVQQLEHYRKLKGVEFQVERLLTEFNARKELEHSQQVEKTAAQAVRIGQIAQMQGHLKLPIPGKIVSAFGRQMDAQSGLYVFKKGIEIAGRPNQPVTSVSEGKIAYSGELAGYGKVAIIDHGNQVYSLCARLGVLSKKAGDAVLTGDRIGMSDASGKPVYFEIRSRNVAVNPLQWVTN